MYIGDEAGSNEVPEPIAFIDMMFVARAPTRMPMSFPFMTMSGPMFVLVTPMSMPGIEPIGVDEGLAAGLGDGDGRGVGVAIECPVCCAKPEPKARRTVAMTNNKRFIGESDGAEL
jgi:hypothetical protein